MGTKISASNDATKKVIAMVGSGHYDVTHYGATGDGTTDDAAAIQSAIDAAGAAGGGVVFFPSGTYTTLKALIIVNDNVHLQGEGIGSSIIRSGVGWTATAHPVNGANSLAGIVSFSGVDNFACRDIFIDGITNNIPGNGIVAVPDNVVTTFSTPCTNGVIENNKVMIGTTSTGYHIWNQLGKHIKICNNFVDGSIDTYAASSTKEGIESYGGEDVLISGNTVINIGNNAIFLTSNGSVPNSYFQDIRIIGNYIKGCDSGVFIQPSSSAESTTNITATSVAEPTVVTAAGHGLLDGQRITIRNIDAGTYDTVTGLPDGAYVVQGADIDTFQLYHIDGITPVACTVEDTDFSAASQATVAYRGSMDARGIVVADNNISTFYLNGISINNAADDLAEALIENISIANNTLIGCPVGAGAVGITGVSLVSAASTSGNHGAITVCGNSILNVPVMGNSGIAYMQNMGGVSFVNNNIKTDDLTLLNIEQHSSRTGDFRGFMFTGCASCQVIGNMVDGAQAAGVQLLNQTDVTINDNNFLRLNHGRVGQAAIDIDNVDRGSIKNNSLSQHTSPFGGAAQGLYGVSADSDCDLLWISGNRFIDSNSTIYLNLKWDPATFNTNQGTFTLGEAAQSVTITNSMVSTTQAIVVHQIVAGAGPLQIGAITLGTSNFTVNFLDPDGTAASGDGSEQFTWVLLD